MFIWFSSEKNQPHAIYMIAPKSSTIFTLPIIALFNMIHPNKIAPHLDW